MVIGISAAVFLNSSKRPQYKLEKVQRGNVTEYVSETGIISATGIVAVTSPSTGVVTEVMVKNGDVVKTGAILFTVKSSATEQEKSLALSNYLAAKSALDVSNSNALKLQAVMFDKWDSFRKLATSDTYETSDEKPRYENRSLPEFHISEKQWLAAEQDYKQQQNVISQAKAVVASTWFLYSATQNAVVKATADGVIQNLAVAANSSVVASATKPSVLISSSSATEATVALSEYSIAKVKEGQPVVIDVKAVTSRIYHGYVNRLDSVGSDVKGVMRYNVYMQLTDPDDHIRPGMSIDVTITTNSRKNVLTVPNSAVKPYRGGRAVRVVGKKNEVIYVPVSVGVRGKTKTEILKGLEENQPIIVSLPNELIKRSGLF
jgi:HlyD family secretion protein